jgi:hypothetical protein
VYALPGTTLWITSALAVRTVTTLQHQQVGSFPVTILRPRLYYHQVQGHGLSLQCHPSSQEYVAPSSNRAALTATARAAVATVVVSTLMVLRPTRMRPCHARCPTADSYTRAFAPTIRPSMHPIAGSTHVVRVVGRRFQIKIGLKGRSST